MRLLCALPLNSVVFTQQINICCFAVFFADLILSYAEIDDVHLHLKQAACVCAGRVCLHSGSAPSSVLWSLSATILSRKRIRCSIYLHFDKLTISICASISLCTHAQLRCSPLGFLFYMIYVWVTCFVCIYKWLQFDLVANPLVPEGLFCLIHSNLRHCYDARFLPVETRPLYIVLRDLIAKVDFCASLWLSLQSCLMHHYNGVWSM